MDVSLKPIREQVVVITGGSNGIGLATAAQAARLGARVVLAAANERALDRGVAGIRRIGGRAVAAVADVADLDQVSAIAAIALAEFGAIDSWVNAGGHYVYASHVAVRHLRRGGGALINVASPRDTGHSLHAFTNSLRIDIADENLPIAVTLVRPASAQTPPDAVARLIVAAAHRSLGDVTAGSGGAGKAAAVATALGVGLLALKVTRGRRPALRSLLPSAPSPTFSPS
jgi:NAD(P)-dependent dehydrogenase (short-subunit alcohol dehydrogenase family)